MALRIRENGDVLCAAMHEERDGDTYIPDSVSEILTGCTGKKALLITDPEPIHSTHGQWWWAGNSKFMKTIIAGSRNVTNYTTVLEAIKESNFSISTVISGGAKGVDRLGEIYAQRNGLDLEIFEAEWHMYGNRAGMIRNSQMAENADALIAVWDGQSSGTRNMIKVAKAKGLKVYIKYVE